MANIGPTGEVCGKIKRKIGLIPIPFWTAVGINGLRTVEVGTVDGTAAGGL